MDSMPVRAVKVNNVSIGASEQDIREFFSFSGEIEHVEMKSVNERSQLAHVVFKDSQGAETAVLLSGATIVDQSVTVELDPDYKPKIASSVSPAATGNTNADGAGAGSAVQKAEDVVSSMLARGFILGKDALNKAKTFDEKHQFTSSATAKVASLDQRIGLTDKISVGTTIINEKVKDLDQKFQVSEKTKSAYSAAGQSVSTAGSAVMKNRHVLTGVSWVTGAFSRVAKAAEDVTLKTREKVLSEEEQARRAEGYSQLHDPESPKATSAATTTTAR